MSELCPCGSGRPLDQCCGPYLEGRAWPDDAGTMVRSRFSAYCLGKFDYLVETTHPAYREDLTAQMLEEQTRDVHWLRLDMGPCEKDQPEGGNGELFDTAEFYAYYELEGSVRRTQLFPAQGRQAVLCGRRGPPPQGLSPSRAQGGP